MGDVEDQLPLPSITTSHRVVHRDLMERVGGIEFVPAIGTRRVEKQRNDRPWKVTGTGLGCRRGFPSGPPSSGPRRDRGRGRGVMPQ